MRRTGLVGKDLHGDAFCSGHKIGNLGVGQGETYCALWLVPKMIVGKVTFHD
jgi:hypothetical protein